MLMVKIDGFGRKSRVAQMYPYPLQPNSWAVEVRPGLAAKLDFHLHLLQLQQATLCCYSSSSSRSDSGKSNARKASESDPGSSKLKLTHPTKDPSPSAENAAELISLSRV